MGIPRKGSRKIIVEGRSFLWTTRHGGSRFMGYSNRNMGLVIQEDCKNPGRVFQLNLESLAWSESFEEPEPTVGHRASLLPGDVSVIIKKALVEGWDPSSKEEFSLSSQIKLSEYQTS